MREQLVRFKYQAPFCRFVIRLGDGGRIHVDAPGQLRPFDERVQYTDSRGRWMWIAYPSHEAMWRVTCLPHVAAVEFKDQPLIPPAAY